MSNQLSVSSRVLAFLLPAILGLSCVERDWNFCSPDDKCRTGYTCTADWRCVRDVDGGADGLVAVDGNGTADKDIGTDSPAVTDAAGIGRDAAEPDAAPLTASPDAPVDTRPDSPADAAPDAPAPDAPNTTGGAGGSGGSTVTDVPLATGGTTSNPDAPNTTGGAGGSGGGGVSGTAGGSATGGTSATGGITGTGGMGVGGSGSGGQVSCGGSTKLCNGSCIPSASCCGGCSGNTPVCSNGTCVGRSIGDTCSSGQECASTVCADGVCCNTACDGQCELCSIPGSKGTCAPTTTPRTACKGTGTCGGICDGSAQNRKTCVFPDSTTSCGVSASCSGGKLATAAVCNGDGTCNASKTSTCTYGCKTDGTIACATSCPSGQGLCGGSCVDILSTASHCGGACQVCSGTTPYCHSGSCVQCLSGADCVSYADGATCGPNYSCQCAAPTAGNLVQNGGFDSALGLTGWTYVSDGLTTSSSDDAAGCPTSGSVEVTVQYPNTGGLSQCVPVVAANTTYNFGYSYVQQVAGALICNLLFHAGTNCPGQWFSVASLVSDATAGTGWYSTSMSITSPAGAGSVTVSCDGVLVNGSQAGWFDQIYLNATANQY